ncbi:hypothetical protein [Pseudomonas sp. F3-2]|uniref:hypothetical protein n=1 Tax=Pseudomonas sp. F3-2 TaxID=3141539 RepID=UPI00315DAB50
MKNIQIIDGALNCVYDIFSCDEASFNTLFPAGTDIAFSSEIWEREEDVELESIFRRLWESPVPKSQAMGIHGIIFYGLDDKKQYYPSRRDEDAMNPDGSAIRAGGRTSDLAQP